MSLTPDQAKVIGDYTLTDYEHERALTKRVISAVPAGQEGYAPSAKCMTSLDLVWHIAASELVFLKGVSGGQFSAGEPKRPDHIHNAQDVLAWYDENLPPAVARARQLSAEQLAQVIDYFGILQLPGVAYLTQMVKHSAHHRGQLSAYLRPMGAKVPGIYGASGDTQ